LTPQIFRYTLGVIVYTTFLLRALQVFIWLFFRADITFLQFAPPRPSRGFFLIFFISHSLSSNHHIQPSHIIIRASSRPCKCILTIAWGCGIIRAVLANAHLDNLAKKGDTFVRSMFAYRSAIRRRIITDERIGLAVCFNNAFASSTTLFLEGYQ
jgi:hypothetical protein